jgi:hypothetical protein
MIDSFCEGFFLEIFTFDIPVSLRHVSNFLKNLSLSPELAKELKD